jgi:putative (di)nucleoside polyphosphate hydrolase
MADDDHLYRRAAAIMLLNRDGKVFVGARIDNLEDAWQMPQGGLDDGEEPWTGALRELEEETGIPPDLVQKIAEHPERLRYDLPPDLKRKKWGGRFKGQVQHWYLARFLGTDEDVNLLTKHPEFRAWKWVEPDEVPELIVPFKRDLYRRLLKDFATYL